MATFSRTGDPATIIVCDDDADTRSIIKLGLSAVGHDVIECSSAAEAMAVCRKALPDLIVMDVLMPEMSGIEFVRWLRATVTDHFVPVLLLTALTELESRVEGLHTGADDYVTKPFQLRELQARVDALLRTRVLTERLHQKTAELERANSQLEKAQEALVAKERELAIVQLAGAAAHNLRQPVTSVLLTCHLLQQKIKELEALSEEGREELLGLIESLRREAHFMESVVSKMVTVDPQQTEDYPGGMKIVDLKVSKSGKTGGEE